MDDEINVGGRQITLRQLQLVLSDRDFDGDDYETLLQMDSENVIPAFTGASEGEINRLPLSEVTADDIAGNRRWKGACSVCLEDLAGQAGVQIRTIPCLHQFHKDCIDPWLRENATCPVCKFSAIG